MELFGLAIFQLSKRKDMAGVIKSRQVMVVDSQLTASLNCMASMVDMPCVVRC